MYVYLSQSWRCLYSWVLFLCLISTKRKKKNNNNLLGGHFLIFLCSSIFLFLVFFFLYDLRTLYLGSPMELITYNVFMLQGPEPACSQQLLSQKTHTVTLYLFFFFCILKRLPFFSHLWCHWLHCYWRGRLEKRKKRDRKIKQNTVHGPLLLLPPLLPWCRHICSALQLIAVQLLHWEEW